ncbi:MAG TPA: hypothetical protein VMT29_11490 [Steroidobacteraceae bacterium]|nr:hypothetical protein [Steroidobacteraceae bacterium]
MSSASRPHRPGPLALAVLLLVSGTAASAATPEDTAITIYSSQQPGAISPDLYRPLPGAGVPNAESVPGYAMIRQERDVKLDSGRSTLKFTDVAALIDPTTVTFTSLTDPRTRVLEQSYQFDLVSTDKLLLKYIDKPIVVERQVGDKAETISGTLLSSFDGLVLKTSDGAIQALRNYSSVRFPELPGGLDTRPTLVWDVQSARAGEQRSRVTYQTGGVTWWADYNLIFNEGKDANSGLLDLSAWVSIINQSGATYRDARLKLIAGDVHRATPEQRAPMAKRALATLSEAAPDAEGFTEKSFFEFHLYTLQRRTTLANNSTRQIELFDQARQIPAHKVLLYYGAPQSFYYAGPLTDRNLGIASNKKVDVYLEFRNDRQYGLGVPLPAGRIRVSKLDTADNSLEFIGEDRIDHTPKDEAVRIKLGSAFDVVGERRQTDFAVDTKAQWLEETFEIKLRNHKDQPVRVLVKENLYRWSNWSIVSKSHEFEKEDARTITFPVDVPRDGETVVRYKVRYTW